MIRFRITKNGKILLLVSAILYIVVRFRITTGCMYTPSLLLETLLFWYLATLQPQHHYRHLPQR